MTTHRTPGVCRTLMETQKTTAFLADYVPLTTKLVSVKKEALRLKDVEFIGS